MNATARRRWGYTHDIETGSGHTIVADEPVADGGNDSGASPTSLLAAILAGEVEFTDRAGRV